MMIAPRLALALTMLPFAVPAPAQMTPAPAGAAVMPKPAALVADGIPPVPVALAEATRPYMEFRTAGIAGWDARDRSMLVTTRFANTNQLHRVAGPLMAREQLTFEAEPVTARVSPAGDVTIVTRDTGGNEFFQLFRYDAGRLTLLTDGKSRNAFGAFSRDGRRVGYSSTRRNGADSDLYVVDPRDPKSDRLVARVKGGGWQIADFAPDGRSAVVTELISVQKSNLHRLDIASGRMTPIGDHSAAIAWRNPNFAPDGTLWATSDEGSDFRRLGTVDIATGRFTPRSPETRWDVENIEMAEDGRFIAYTVNEAGSSRLRVLDTRSGAVRDAAGLPAGVITAVRIAPWGAIGVTLSSATSPADAWVVDPQTMAATRWTESEAGGLDTAVNAAPELVEVRSFDGERVSGFLYRPDPKRFPGRRPLIVSIHGGPEGQSQPQFLGRSNYLINELGIAVFLPNVRGSTGYGKRFVGLDNGPFKREDSVKDIGAFLDAMGKDRRIDPRRIAVTGGSYGGYMCYASAIRYGARLKAANCIVAISDFNTFLANTESYRRDLRRVEYGDERDPAQRAKLAEISPMTSVDRLTIPLLVVTGGNDPRVPASEADQIVKAVRAKGRPAWHLLGQNEGHGFAKKDNQDYNFWVSLMFWRQHLLGEAPAGAAPAASAQ